MKRSRVPDRGDVYWIDPNPVSGREMKNKHPFVVITPKEINALGLVMAVPVTSGGQFARKMGLTVPITGQKTHGVAVCNQVRTFDIQEREKMGSVRYVETLKVETAEDIVSRVLSVIDPN